MRRITAPIIARITTAVFTLSAALIIAPLLVVAAIAAAALIVAMPLMPPMSLMVTTMTTPAAALTEAALAAARTEGALMPLLPLWPTLLGISLKPGGLSSSGACVTRIGSVGRLR